MVTKWLGNGPICSWNVKKWKCLEMARKWSNMVRKCSGNVRKWSKMVKEWSKMVQDGLWWYNMVWNGPKWLEIEQGGLKWLRMVLNGSVWSKMVQKGQRWSKIKKLWKMLEALNFFLNAYGLSAKGAKAGGKKRNCPIIFTISLVQFLFCVIFFTLCSNLSIWSDR